jgi:hypothetical protein
MRSYVFVRSTRPMESTVISVRAALRADGSAVLAAGGTGARARRGLSTLRVFLLT